MSTSAKLILIDTSCWIEAMRGRGDHAVRREVSELVRSNRARFADMVRLELWNGLAGEAERRFLAEMEAVVETVPTTPEVWRDARALAASSRERGLTVQSADLLVFTCARTHGLALFHRDSHFDELERLVMGRR